MVKYEVGQVLFILAGASRGVVPVRICEEIKRKSLTETTTDYLVNFPGREEPVNLKQADKHVFVSELEAKKYMMNNAELAVDNLLKKAVVVAKKTFDYSRNVAEPSPPSPKENTAPDLMESIMTGEEDATPAEIEVNGTEMLLEDGVTARIHLPPEFQDLIGSG